MSQWIHQRWLYNGVEVPRCRGECPADLTDDPTAVTCPECLCLMGKQWDSMKTPRCMIQGCPKPRAKFLCDEHEAQWKRSREYVRAEIALTDFIDRISAEERNAREPE